MPRMDFTSQDYLRDPATGLAKLRAAGPVVEVRFPIVGKTWITTTSDLAGRVLKDSETFTMRKDGTSCRSALVDARVDTHARGQHADHGRARPYASAQYRRRSLSSPRHSRHGTENFRNCR